MQQSVLRPALLVALFSLTPLALAVNADPVLAKAESLLAGQEAKAAFDLLAPLEDDRAGSPDYDYLYGMAALESGQADRAAFAFERCLMVEPKNGPCRVQMARTHMALGENDSARAEFTTIQNDNPPAEVNALVSRYLGGVAQMEKDAKRSVGAWAKVGAGHDSNVNSATSSSSIAIPLFNNFTFALNGLAVQNHDAFAQAGAGANAEFRLSPSWSLNGSASLTNRTYQDIDAYSNTALDADIGLSWHEGENGVQAKLQGQSYYLDGDAFRSFVGVLGQYQLTLSRTSALTAYAQISSFDYRVNSPSAMRYTVGGGYSHAFAARWSPVLFGGAYAGTEVSDISNIGAGQDFMGLRAGGSLTVHRMLSLTASASVEQRTYDAKNPLFLVVREDTQADLSVGAVYTPIKHFSIRPTVSYSQSNSNIGLYEFDRQVFSLDFHYEI